MWTSLENFYLQLLRIFFLVTTSIVLIVMVIALAMGINDLTPRENAYYAQHYTELRQKTNAIDYLSKFIPEADVAYLKANVKLSDATTTHEVSNVDKIDKQASERFLALFGRHFIQDDGFANAEASNRESLRWHRAYDSSDNDDLSPEKKQQYDTSAMFWSLYSDYSTDLIACADALKKKYGNKDPIYDDANFEGHVNETGLPSKWIRQTTNDGLKELEPKLDEVNLRNAARKARAVLDFLVAGGSLLYFVVVMFYFVFVKIERNLRALAGQE